MIRKQTWIALIIFGLLLGLALYINRNPIISSASSTPSPTLMPSLLEGWQDSDIAMIQYKGDPGEITLNHNPDGSWSLGPENIVPASIEKVDSFRYQLLSISVQSLLNTTDPLDAVGLAAPKRILVLRDTQGKQVEIRIGNQTPTGSGYYVQIDNQTPVVVSKYFLITFYPQYQGKAWLHLRQRLILHPYRNDNWT